MAARELLLEDDMAVAEGFPAELMSAETEVQRKGSRCATIATMSGGCDAARLNHNLATGGDAFVLSSIHHDSPKLQIWRSILGPLGIW